LIEEPLTGRALDENEGRLQNEEQSATWAIGLSRALSYARSTRRCLPSPNGSAKHDRAMASLVPGHSHRVRTDDVCGPIDFDVDRELMERAHVETWGK